MKELTVKIEGLERIKPKIYLLGFKSSYLAAQASPGQFLHIKIDNKVTILRRPFSIHSIRGNMIYILFKARGKGTNLLSQYNRADSLDIIGPLGKGFIFRPPMKKNRSHVLMAGGIGVAPLLFLGERLRNLTIGGSKPQVLSFLGAKTKKEILSASEFEKLKCKVHISTEDGSAGLKGKVTALLKNLLCAMGREIGANIYTCGPKEMILEIKEILKDYPLINCQVSFDQFMGCGLGVCSGCSIETKNGYKKVCKDGPVFDLNEL